MRQNTTQVQSNEDKQSKQKNNQKLFELYYNTNIYSFANSLKKCIRHIDTNYENKFIRKNDKVWVQTNLSKLFHKHSDKLEKNLLSKNQHIKNTIQNYHQYYTSMPKQLLNQINKQQFAFQLKPIRTKKKFNTIPSRNQSFSVQLVNSQPSCKTLNFRQRLTSKKVFRVRQFKNNLQQTINNTRYVQKLQKIKLQSTYAEFFFKKDIYSEESKNIDFEKANFDKIKLMTSIRWNFSLSQKTQKLKKPLFQQQTQNLKKFLGFQLRKQNYYKPKSKCHSRDSKIFLNF